MVKKRIIAVIALSILLSGCSIIGDAVRESYQSKRSLKKGATLVNLKGLYGLTVPADGYYYEEDPTGISLIPEDILSYEHGNYQIKTFPVEMVPKDVNEDLFKSFKWISRKFIAPRAKIEPEITQSQERDFRGEKALYLETFIKGKITGDEKFTVVEKPSFGYANLVFYHKGYLYWIYHSDPCSDRKTYSIPQVKETTKSEFEEFVGKVSIDPRNK